MKEIQSLKKELEKTKHELEIQTWGLKKTNQGVKLLYEQLARKNEELEKLNSLKTDFINMVSHELRLPIAIIQEGISLLLDEAAGSINGAQKRLYEMMNRSTKRLIKMINNILDISKIESGKIEVNRNVVDLIDIINQVVADFKLKIKEKDLSLKENLPTQEVWVFVDKDKILQVFYNLLGNAIKFTSKGFIEIGVVPKKNKIECSVTDSGKGIRKEHIPKLFDKFEQFDTDCDPAMKGSGLGLSIVKSIISLHQGNIEVKSEINKGTKFKFSLPRYTPDLLLKEVFSDKINQALAKNFQFIFILLFIKNSQKSTKKITDNTIINFLRDLKKDINTYLVKNDDFIFHNSHEMYLIHSFYKINEEKLFINQVKHCVNDFLHKNNLKQIITYNLKYLRFPEKAKYLEKLIYELEDNNLNVDNLLSKIE